MPCFRSATPPSDLDQLRNDTIPVVTRPSIIGWRGGIIVALLMVMAAPGLASARFSPALTAAALSPIDSIVQSEIEAGRIPGAVIEIGQSDHAVYRRAFGYRELAPSRVAMTPDTVFDLASLTKVVATTVAIMQLADAGKLDLDAPAARYWPAFGRYGKSGITIRQLMTHYSGLKADLDLSAGWTGYRSAMKMIEAAHPDYPPGSHYEYSDINFETLGEVVRRVSGTPLDSYCRKHIFGPLRMNDTGFDPPPSVYPRIAPTLFVNGKLRVGVPHDPTAARMGGVAGHAGLFSTADDLAAFARAMLDASATNRACVLSRHAIDEMTIPRTPAGAARLRGLGWDLAAPFAPNRDQLPPVGSYGHTGFTGTMLWIDPLSSTWVIVLTNRTYPDGRGDAGPLRKKLLALVADQLAPVSEQELITERPELRPYCPSPGRPRLPESNVASGADVLVADGFVEMNGKRVGLITNQTGVTRAGISDIDAFSRAPNVKLSAIFSPEHGLYGDVDDAAASGVEPRTGLPLFSLYGRLTHPSDAMLEGIDALVFDVQDSGARFYTYMTTMAYAMEAAARRGIDFYVLDRPNPISAAVVQGPVLDANRTSFTGYFPLPTRHGMTAGELAGMFNREKRIGARLHVIEMRGYHRGEWYDATGLKWIPPSPNLRTLSEAVLYPGVAMAEGANVSVGRGTATPFELVGAPWADANQLTDYLNHRGIAGVRFEPAAFAPVGDHYAGRTCKGSRIIVEDRDALDSPRLGIELIAALRHLYPDTFDTDSTLAMVGSAEVLNEIKSDEDPRSIAARWQPSLHRFEWLRSAYLLYDSAPTVVAGAESSGNPPLGHQKLRLSGLDEPVAREVGRGW